MKLRQKDRDTRWTMKFSNAKGKGQAVRYCRPGLRLQNHASIDHRHGFIRGWTVCAPVGTVLSVRSPVSSRATPDGKTV